MLGLRRLSRRQSRHAGRLAASMAVRASTFLHHTRDDAATWFPTARAYAHQSWRHLLTGATYPKQVLRPCFAAEALDLYQHDAITRHASPYQRSCIHLV